MMNRVTIVLLTLPPLSMALTVALQIVSGRVSLSALWILFILSLVTSLACGFRAVVLLKSERPGGYVCGVAAMLYLVLLLCAVGVPPRIIAGIQPSRFSQQPPLLQLSEARRGSLLSRIAGFGSPAAVAERARSA
jgi:hypothetical protein